MQKLNPQPHGGAIYNTPTCTLDRAKDEDPVSLADVLVRTWENEAEPAEEEFGAGADFLNGSFVRNWKRKILDAAAAGDIDGMKQEAAVMAELRVIEIGMESMDDKVALDASKFLLGQAGQGVIQKVETTMKYDSLPDNQLAALVMSKIKKLGKTNPMLLEAAKQALGAHVIEAEYQEVPVQKTPPVDPSGEASHSLDSRE